MKSDQTVKTKNLEAELVVIGGGLSGLAAAVTATENGVKNVVLLEAQDETGGNGPFVFG